MLIKNCEICGREFRTFPCNLKKGWGRFCGLACKAKSFFYRHGQSRSRLYRIWSNMKNRCTCNTTPSYAYYGGRGIKVCKEWIDSFESFRDWALVNGYEDGLELDRRDADGGYMPENCRWATRTEQMRNTRKRSNAKTSAFKGVSWCAGSNKWRAQLCVKGKSPHIGMFTDEREAAIAYDDAARKEFGAFALTNF